MPELGVYMSSHVFTISALRRLTLPPILTLVSDLAILEGRMAIAVKRETRRDTNISLDKPIYTISVASEILETHPRTLMMYEHLGLVVPRRTSTNRRRFSQRDVMKLQTIQKLTRQHSVNLAGVRYIMKLLKLLHEHQLPSPVELRDIDVSQLDV
jgi:DNA-binding transcriptional MerR regulator